MEAKAISDMTQEELAEENRKLASQISFLQVRKGEVMTAFSAGQETAKALAATKTLTREKRSALMRALEKQQADEDAAAEADKANLAAVAASAAKDPMPKPVKK